MILNSPQLTICGLIDVFTSTDFVHKITFLDAGLVIEYNIEQILRLAT